MKAQKSLLRAIVLAFWLAACTQAPQAPEAQTTEAQAVPAAQGTTLRVDASRTKVVAIGTKVTGRHEIAFPVQEGSLIVGSEGCLTGGKVIVNLAELQVLDLQGEDKAKLEKHLKSDDFFAADKNPQGILEITGCEKGAQDTVFISANLTLRGVTKNIRFPAVLHAGPEGLHSLANFNINRQEWGIAYKGRPDNLIRDEVNLSIEVFAKAQ